MTDSEIDAALGLSDRDLKSKSVTKSTEPKAEYSFGLDSEGHKHATELVKLDPAELVESLRQISYDRVTSSGERVSYLDIRSEVCAINIALNIEQIIAPAHREMRRPSNRKMRPGAFTTDDEIISNDRQVIDLHWIHTLKFPVNRVTGYAHLFERPDFDWKLAGQFAAIVAKRDTKAERLGLPEFHEMQLCAIRSSSTVARYQTIDKRIKSSLRPIKAYLSGRSRYEGDVLANADRLYKAMLIARSNPGKARIAYKQMTGHDIPLSRMRRLVDTFHAVVGSKGHPVMAD